MKPENELCSTTEIIDTLEECKVAINGLGETFSKEESRADYPKGCYIYKIPNTQVSLSFWNTPVSGSKNVNGHPICKKGGAI